MGTCSSIFDDDDGGYRRGSGGYGSRNQHGQAQVDNPYLPAPHQPVHPQAAAPGEFRVPGIGEQPCRAPPLQGPPPLSGRKRALLVGINYPGTGAQLRGCINDVTRMTGMLKSQGFQDNELAILTDNQQDRSCRPTKMNIMQGLQWLSRGAVPGDILFFHFSGHGAQQPDPHKLEEDGMNETIVPEDFKRAGMISDDEIFDNVVRLLPDGVRLTVVLDCCHSGTGLDLPFSWERGHWREDTNPWHTLGDVILLSGCEDSQTSADASDQYRRPAGAMTTALCDTIEKHGTGTLMMADLLFEMHQRLKRGGFSQRPMLTSSQKFNANARPFQLFDICPNMNEVVGRFVRKRFEPRPAKNGGPFGNAVAGAALGLAVGVGLGILAGGLMGGLFGD
eukprot:Hpha_TRINITY_DN7472_c0_g1::TRINITY_DN7472_c0_g1_i1::g.95763::m.95763